MEIQCREQSPLGHGKLHRGLDKDSNWKPILMTSLTNDLGWFAIIFRKQLDCGADPASELGWERYWGGFANYRARYRALVFLRCALGYWFFLCKRSKCKTKWYDTFRDSCLDRLLFFTFHLWICREFPIAFSGWTEILRDREPGFGEISYGEFLDLVADGRIGRDTWWVLTSPLERFFFSRLSGAEKNPPLFPLWNQVRSRWLFG